MVDNEIIGLVTVRVSSSRLPQKCLLPFGDGNVLNHIINRARVFEIDPIVCTSIDSSDDIIEKISINEGIRCFRGSLKNKLKRWSDCATKFNLKDFHTIDADDPFFGEDDIKQSMSLLRKGNLDMVCPTEFSSSGGASVGFSLTSNIVKRASESLGDDVDTEMMWYYLEKIPDLRSTQLPGNEPNDLKMRLTLDYEEDYWLLESVRKILGNMASRDEINQLFIQNPDLHKINWFRNDQWKKTQLEKQI